MAIRSARSGLKDLAALGGLASLAPSALQRHALDLADLALDRTLWLAVTGLRGGGKTVFITAIAHHLLLGRELPFLSAVQEERLLGAKLMPLRAGDPPPFPFAGARAALAAAEPSWPTPTERLSALRLRLRFVAKGALRRRLAEHRSLNLEIIDYPGEWLLDLPLLEQDYALWSAQTLAAAERPPRAALASDWRNFLAGLDPSAPADPRQAAQAAALYTRYLERCQAEAGLSRVQPGRFTMPGDLAGSELLQFCPLPHGAASRSGQGSLAALMAERFERYRDTVVRSFYRDHFSRFDRQIVLVDLLGALNRGRACFDDVEAALGTVLRSFRYGPSGLLARLFRPRIEVLLFAASKADHVAHNQHHNLRLLLEQMVREAAGNARFEGIKPALSRSRRCARPTWCAPTITARRSPACAASLRARTARRCCSRARSRLMCRSTTTGARTVSAFATSRRAASCCRVLPSRSTSASTRRSRCCSAIACNERAPAGRALRARSGKDRARRIAVVEPEPALPVVAEAPAGPSPRRPWRRLLVLGGAGFLAALLGLETYDFVAGLFERSDLLGSAFSLLLALAAAGAIGLGASEIASLRRLTALGDLRVTGAHLLSSQVHGRADPLLERVRASIAIARSCRVRSSVSTAGRAMR